jgi:3-dehydrosphinganine reductase
MSSQSATHTRSTLSGRHVAITGGSSGIGLATAKKLAALGAHVAILARNRDRREAAVAEIDMVKHSSALPCLSVACDVADADQVTKAFEAMANAGRSPEILINSAGITEPGYFDRQPMEVFERQMRINYFGTVQTIQAALPAMKARRSGHIVNISSVAGFLGVFGYSGYTASKFAVWGLSEVLRGELRPHGIAVSVVCPPDADTPMLHEEEKIRPAETRAIAGSIKPMPADAVAEAIVRGIARRRFHILPGMDTTFLHFALCVCRPLVWWVMDRKVARSMR